VSQAGGPSFRVAALRFWRDAICSLKAAAEAASLLLLTMTAVDGDALRSICFLVVRLGWRSGAVLNETAYMCAYVILAAMPSSVLGDAE